MSAVVLFAEGRYHRAEMVGRRPLTPPACAADESSSARVVFALPPDGARCRVCYPVRVSPLREDASHGEFGGWDEYEGSPV